MACQYKGFSKVAILAATLLLIQACGTNRLVMPPDADPALNDALSRWDSCVTRATESGATIYPTIDPSTCEGYRRDVSTYYPEHLESRVRSQLQASERQRWMSFRPAAANKTRLPDVLLKLMEDHSDRTTR